MGDFVLEEEPPALITPDKLFEEGDVSAVTRREGSTTWTSVLYIRGHLVAVLKELDDFMESERLNQLLYITGAPGCGKTCFLYLWARRLSVLKYKRVLLIQFRETEACFIWIREADGVLWRMNKSIDASGLEQDVGTIIEKSKMQKRHLICASTMASFKTCRVAVACYQR
jgi:hypothetical protein